MPKKETIIIILVISLIFVIALPLLLGKYNKQIKTSKVKKTYSTLTEVMIRVQLDDGNMIFNDDNEDFDIDDWFDKYIKQYLITKKICYNTLGCWNNGDSYNMNGTVIHNNKTGIGIGENILTTIMNDGTFLDFDTYSKEDISKYFGVNINNDWAIVIFFDINGSNEPNTLGKDIFSLIFTEDGLFPAYKNRTKTQIAADCSTSGLGLSCIQNYLED